MCERILKSWQNQNKNQGFEILLKTNFIAINTKYTLKNKIHTNTKYTNLNVEKLKYSNHYPLH